MKQPKFEIGDRVTYASPELPYQKRRGIGEVVWEMATHYYIRWEDFPKMECPHLKEFDFQESDLLVKVDDLPVQLGDRVMNLESRSEGVVTHVSDRCINITTDDYIESHNLALGKPKLKVLEKFNGDDNFPELLVVPKTHGYIEEYFVVNKQRKVYFYTRYTYPESSGKLKHHHVPKKQKESIETLWRSGATAKEICTALGKSCR